MPVLYGPLEANGQRITGLQLPINPDEPATRAFVEQIVNGRAWKDAVRVYADTNVNIAAPGANIDALAMNPGDPVALGGQTTQTQNGIYVWNGAAATMTRRADADTGAELASGTTFPVAEGTYANRHAIMTTDGTITIGTTAINFIVMNNSGTIYTGSGGVILVGNDFRLDLSANSGLIIVGGKVGVDYSVLARKFAATIGNGAATTFLVNHNFGNRDVIPALYKVSNNRFGLPDIFAEDTNNTRFTFGTAPAANEYRAVVYG